MSSPAQTLANRQNGKAVPTGHIVTSRAGRSAHMRRCSAQPPSTCASKALVDFFERPEESRERVPKVSRAAALLIEIAWPELIGDGGDCRPHRPVLMRPLGPRHTLA